MFGKTQFGKADSQLTEARDLISTLASWIIKIGCSGGASYDEILNDETMKRVKAFMKDTE